MKLLLLDNYDSFTYNLYHYAAQYARVVVCRNDEIVLDDVAGYDGIILSPGPGLPKDAGIMPELIQRYYTSRPMLGVCLGHQAIAEALGAKLVNLPGIYHGVSRKMMVTKPDALFNGMPGEFEVGRYHSWAVDPTTLPKELEVTAVDEKGVCMAIAHTSLAVKGVQFHPESVLTPGGLEIIKNFIGLIG